MRKILALLLLCAACAQSPSGPVNRGYWATVKVWYPGTVSTYSPVFLVYVYGDNGDGHYTEVSFITLDKEHRTFAGADSIAVTPISR